MKEGSCGDKASMQAERKMVGYCTSDNLAYVNQAT